jgi:hypothetical protein
MPDAPIGATEACAFGVRRRSAIEADESSVNRPVKIAVTAAEASTPPSFENAAVK